MSALSQPALWTLHSLWLSVGSSAPYTASDIPDYDQVHPKALEALEELRERRARRWTVTSAHRSSSHNRAVKGASKSMHLSGKAFDIRVPHWARESFYEHAKASGFRGFGWGAGQVHIDIRAQEGWWSYDAGKHVGGLKKWAHLYKAPESFRQAVEESRPKGARGSGDDTLRERGAQHWKTLKWDTMMLCRDLGLCSSASD